MSSVCDAGNIVKENQNGYLFSPTDISSIADAIAGFATLPLPEREAMGRCSREMAERYFDVGKFGDMYENILTAAWRREKPSCGHWLQDVPQTALKFCKKASN
jgi:glycosyltransferase involved in cell wall biosynthesis